MDGWIYVFLWKALQHLQQNCEIMLEFSIFLSPNTTTNTSNSYQKALFCSHPSTGHFPKDFCLVHMIFSKLQTISNVLFWRAVACSVFSWWLTHNIRQCKRGLQLPRSYPGLLCDLTHDYTPHSWSYLSWSTPPGEGHNGVKFLPFVHSLSYDRLVESKLFRDCFVTVSSLLSINNPFSEVLRNLIVIPLIENTRLCHLQITC